jgi:hypothetical protein
MPTGVMGLVVAAAGLVRCMPALPDIGTANRLRESPPADWQGGRHLDPEARPEAASRVEGRYQGRCASGGVVRKKRAPARHVSRIANGGFISLREST